MTIFALFHHHLNHFPITILDWLDRFRRKRPENAFKPCLGTQKMRSKLYMTKMYPQNPLKTPKS